MSNKKDAISIVDITSYKTKFDKLTRLQAH